MIEDRLRERLSGAVDGVRPRAVLTVSAIDQLALRHRRRQRSRLASAGVVLTVLALILVAVGLGRRGEQAGKRPAPFAATPSAPTSQQLLVLVQPIVERVLAPYHLGTVTIEVGDPSAFRYDPVVTISGPVYFRKGNLSLRTFGLTVSQRAFVEANVVMETVPAAGKHDTASWPGGFRARMTDDPATGPEFEADRSDLVTFSGQALATSFPFAEAGGRPSPVATRLFSIGAALAAALPRLAPLPRPPAIRWVQGPGDRALVALQRAAAGAPDPAADATVLYLKGRVVDPYSMHEDDTEERWYSHDGKQGVEFAYGVLLGKPHSGYSGPGPWLGLLAGRRLDYGGVRALSTSVQTLQDMASRYYGEQLAGSSAVFGDIANLLEESPASPRLKAALTVVAGRLPGVLVTTGVTDPLGRPAISIEVPSSITAGRLYVSPQTGTFLALAELDRNHQVKQYRALEQVAAVKAIRVRPDGVVPKNPPRK